MGRGNTPEKGGEVDVEMGGWHFFITLQFICIYCVCVCVGGEGVSFLYYILVLHSFELTVQDSHLSFFFLHIFEVKVSNFIDL